MVVQHGFGISFRLDILAHWAGTHFGLLCCSVHGSGRVHFVSSSSRSQPSDIDSGKLAFVSRGSRLVILEPQDGGRGAWGARQIQVQVC